jgi:hypothetical protein
MDLQRTRAETAARLAERRGEIEEGALTRIHSLLGDPADPQLQDELTIAIAAAVDYAMAAVEVGESQALPVPAPLLDQARLAAREGVALDSVLRRFLVGYTLFGEYLVREVPDGSRALKWLLRDQAVFFDRLLEAIGGEYRKEASGGRVQAHELVARRVRRLLRGDASDAAGIPYEFEGWHIGAVVVSHRGREPVVQPAVDSNPRLLIVRQGDGTVWGWLGARKRPSVNDRHRLAAMFVGSAASVALGEPGCGLDGWRLTHMQAKAALPVALRGWDRTVTYSDVGLLAAALRDRVLVSSLRHLYLEPLEKSRDRGQALRETLRVYFATDRNVSSTAAALGVNRSTVASRLRSVEESIGRQLTACAAEIEVALRLEELEARTEAATGSPAADPADRADRAVC